MSIKVLLFIAIALIIFRWFKKKPVQNQQPSVQTHFIKEPSKWKSPFSLKQISGVTEIEFEDGHSYFKVHLYEGTVHKMVFAESGIAQAFYQSLFDQLEGENRPGSGGNA